MAERLIESIKKVSSGVRDAQENTEIVYGKVISEEPVVIQIGQRLMLDEKRLIFTDNVRKIERNVEVNWNTETSDSHSHSIKGKKMMTEDNRLKNGDMVVMLKMQGGQKYVVLSKVVI